MEPPKFTPAELEGLVAEAVSWLREQRDKFHPLGVPLSEPQKIKLRPFFSAPDAAHMTAIPFIDVAVFNREPTLRTVFHTLVHVAQFTVLRLERVMKGYFETINESGLWMVVPYEEQAYRLDTRYTKDPSDYFSVEAEIREWQRNGEF